jgi:shikimate kinase
MDGYYDHGPLVELRRPLVITSPLRDFTRAVTYRTTSLLGLPFHDIDRLVEHHTGRSIEQLLLEEGEQAYRAAESTCLASALGQRPWGLVGLADQERPLPERGGGSSSDFALVVLDFELANLYWRIQATARQRESSRWHPLFEGLPQSIDELRPFWSQWRRAHASPDLQIQADSLSVAEISNRLQSWLQDSER